MDWFFDIVLPDPRLEPYRSEPTMWWLSTGLILGFFIGVVFSALLVALFWWWF